MVDVRIDTTVMAPSGYAYAARKLIVGAHEQGLKISLFERPMDPMRIQVEPEEMQIFQKMFKESFTVETPLVNYGVPVVFPPKPNHVRNILYFYWELERLPPLWVRLLEGYDEFMTNTQFCGQCIRNSVPEYYEENLVADVVTKPINVIPLGVNTEVFYPDSDKLYNLGDDKFIFLSVGQWTNRKGFKELIEAFLLEFQGDEDVVLLLKTYERDNSFPSMINIVNTIKIKSFVLGIKKPPKIIIHGKMLNEEGMRKLYNSANCFVLPSKGESWCLPYLQSMACGITSIAQKFSGHLEYMNDRNSFLIAPKEMVLADGSGWYDRINNIEWAQPSIKSLRTIMRHAYEHPQVLSKKGKQGLIDAKKWSWDNAAKKFIEVIKS